jgi:acyl-CoA thioesterase I
MKMHVTRIVTGAMLAGLLAFVVTPAVRGQMAEPVIVALGDSLTAGLGLPREEAFPAQLEAALRARGHEVRIADAGVSGDTASAALTRLDWALPEDASAAIVELGGNDALRGIDPAQTKAALEQIIVKLKERELPILLAGMEAPRNMGRDYVEAFSAIYRDLAEKYDLILYPFFLDGVALDAELMQADGIHPNAKGVARIVEGITPKVDQLLAEIDSGR